MSGETVTIIWCAVAVISLVLGAVGIRGMRQHYRYMRKLEQDACEWERKEWERFKAEAHTKNLPDLNGYG